jgi:hypothetical protein
MPKSIKKRKKKSKKSAWLPKFRRHIYLTEALGKKVEKRAKTHTGGNFSMMCQVLLSDALEKHDNQPNTNT